MNIKTAKPARAAVHKDQETPARRTRIGLSARALEAWGLHLETTDDGVEIWAEGQPLSDAAHDGLQILRRELGLSPTDAEELMDVAISLHMWARVRYATR